MHPPSSDRTSGQCQENAGAAVNDAFLPSDYQLLSFVHRCHECRSRCLGAGVFTPMTNEDADLSSSSGDNSYSYFKRRS